jgi:hypothetical protein
MYVHLYIELCSKIAIHNSRKRYLKKWIYFSVLRLRKRSAAVEEMIVLQKIRQRCECVYVYVCVYLCVCVCVFVCVCVCGYIYIYIHIYIYTHISIYIYIYVYRWVFWSNIWIFKKELRLKIDHLSGIECIVRDVFAVKKRKIHLNNWIKEYCIQCKLKNINKLQCIRIKLNGLRIWIQKVYIYIYMYIYIYVYIYIHICMYIYIYIFLYGYKR